MKGRENWRLEQATSHMQVSDLSLRCLSLFEMFADRQTDKRIINKYLT